MFGKGLLFGPDQLSADERANRASGLTMLGTALSQMAYGKPVDLSGPLQALEQRKQDAAMRKAMEVPGVMDKFTPQQQAVLAAMPAELATKIIMEQAFAPAPDPTKGVVVGNNVINPITGETIYQGEASAQAAEYGLTPQFGVDEKGNPVILQLGKDGTAVQTAIPDGVTFQKEPIKVDAGTKWILLDPITRQPVGEVDKQLYEAEQQKAAGKAAGESSAALESLNSKIPGLQEVMTKLDDLSGKATYTWAGQIYNEGRKQLGLDPTEGAVARTEYMAVVDNQVLPLLRDTFGAQFTEREGAALRATLGDVNKTPEEKRAVLNAFIEQKMRDVEAMKARERMKSDQPSAPVVIDGFTIEEVP